MPDVSAEQPDINMLGPERPDFRPLGTQRASRAQTAGGGGHEPVQRRREEGALHDRVGEVREQGDDGRTSGGRAEVASRQSQAQDSKVTVVLLTQYTATSGV